VHIDANKKMGSLLSLAILQNSSGFWNRKTTVKNQRYSRSKREGGVRKRGTETEVRAIDSQLLDMKNQIQKYNGDAGTEGSLHTSFFL